MTEELRVLTVRQQGIWTIDAAELDEKRREVAGWKHGKASSGIS